MLDTEFICETNHIHIHISSQMMEKLTGYNEPLYAAIRYLSHFV